jgi:hypothetical protein
MKDLETETRLDVIRRSVESVSQPCQPDTLAKLIERNLREYDMYHAMKLWQQEL